MTLEQPAQHREHQHRHRPRQVAGEPEGAEGGQRQHRGDQIRHGHLHHIGQQRDEQQPQHNQQEGLAEVGEDDGVNDVGLLAYELRPAGHIVQGERRQHHRRGAAPWDAEGQQGGHGAGLAGAVGGLRRHHPRRVALTETLRLRMAVLGGDIGDKVRHRRADAGDGADEDADHAAPQNHPGVGRGVTETLEDPRRADPPRLPILHQIGFMGEPEQFRGGEHPHHGRNRRHPVQQITDSHGAAADPGLAVTDGADKQPETAGDEPFHHRLVAETGD